MKDKYLRSLELDKILNMLSQRAASSEAKERALEITPAESSEDVHRLMNETSDAHMLMARYGAPSFTGLYNIANQLRRAEAGSVLNMKELLVVLSSLRAVMNIYRWRSKCEGAETVLNRRFAQLYPNQYMIDRIFSCIVGEDEMADTASPDLKDIRRKILKAEDKVRNHLNQIIHSPNKQKYLQEAIITIRSGRYVVPVKAEYRSEIPGLVHDTSSSGSTVFIEPMTVVEANNEIRVLRAEEREEIDRILRALSAEAGSFADDIITGIEMATELDLIFAKASLAYDMKAVVPAFNENGLIRINKARHPLIDSKRVVPTDVLLGDGFDTLLITGPNTGGKTVALKTIGLLTAMAMCGLMIPAAENSEIAIFSKILVDIGDEQSIEQSLSTFSGHMTNLISIIKEADDKSLILIDEIGAGTDPVEGAALAIAILEELRNKRSSIIVTTHYAELKEFALKTRGVENGCCEFDIKTLRPTYKLLIGVPGSSNAFAISSRLGIDDSIVERAKQLVSEEDSEFESMMQGLESRRQDIEDQKKQAELANVKAQRLLADLEEQHRLSEKHAATELEVAKREALRLVNNTREQVEAILDEMQDAKKKGKLTPEERARIQGKLNTLENQADPIQKGKKSDYKLPRELQVGDSVIIIDLNKEATVIEVTPNSNMVTVQAGSIKTKVKKNNLKLTERKKQEKPTRSITKNVQSKRSGTAELDIRGENALDGIVELDRFIDNAVLNHLSTITVIHGKGTGVLRKAVHDHLRRHKSVKSYRLGVFGEGESGVTIIELK